jgi:hypothetical protein
VDYLDRTVVTKYIAVEPNVLMHGQIRERAAAARFTSADGTLEILACGAEDTESILSAAQAPVDTIVSILTLCTVPAPQATLRVLIEKLLAPAGLLLFIEHVRGRRSDIAWGQKLLTPFWARVLDGCCLDRPTDLWIKELVDEHGESVWAEGEIWNPTEGDNEENLFWRRVGRFLKK